MTNSVLLEHDLWLAYKSVQGKKSENIASKISENGVSCEDNGSVTDMFIDQTALLRDNPTQLNYGIAVLDGDQDGNFEFLVAGFGGRNLLLKWDGSAYIDIARVELADRGRQAIGVAAADIDADGNEEVYILNTDTYSGQKALGDRLFDLVDDVWTDLFELPHNVAALNMTAGRSVAAVDRMGDGQYGFFVANYGGPMRLYELDDDGNMRDVAPSAGVALTTGGRGVVSFPMMSEFMDIFAGNERGPNFLFRNNGDGTFDEIAQDVGLDDPYEHMRGVAVLDLDGNSGFALVYGNWEGAHRLFVPSSDGHWDDIAPPLMALSSRIRTVIAADFDNDGYQEIFFNNIGQDNRLFGWREGNWIPLNIGDALERDGLGTGAAVADLDGDGRLELLIAHGESGAQPLSLYHSPENSNNWLRVLPLTRYGAPARGAIVTIQCDGRRQHRPIDAGSGYLCQMEPVAHFGLGEATHVDWIEVRWPDGKRQRLDQPAIKQVHRIPYPQR